MPRILRTLLVTALALTAWLVSVPAFAGSGSGAVGAGLCSQRGTSEVAPTPVFMPSESSLEQGDGVFGCEGAWEQHSVQRGQERIEWSSSSADATLGDRLTLLRAGLALARLDQEVSAPLQGVRLSVERPPRAL